jgi:hypothetical protein
MYIVYHVTRISKKLRDQTIIISTIFRKLLFLY